LVENSQNIEVPRTINEAALEVRRLLDESTRLQMIADVPVGAFLSGGVDSSTIVALVSRQSSRPIQTYSVAFQTTKNITSELPYARIVSDKYSTLHEEIVIKEEDILQHFDEIVLALDQPSTDGFNSYVVSSAAR
jgi:asparagine synthase (glutamine-hydrolysing)